MAKTIVFIVSLALALVTGGCAEDLGAPPPDGLSPPPVLELIGIDGRRLTTGDVYWVPFDEGRATDLWDTHREAMALVNPGALPVEVEDVWLEPLGDTLPEELRVLAPSRADERGLGELPRALAPGDSLDFDVRLSPRASGVRAALLVVRWSHGPDLRVELRGRGAGDLRLVAPDEVRGWTLALAAGAGDGAMVAGTLAEGNLYALARHQAAAGGPTYDLVARVSPGGALQWATALDREGGPRERATMSALCVGEGVVVAVGEARDDQGRTELLAHALGLDGALRWSRRWRPDEALGARGLDCALGAGRLWLAAAVETEGAGERPRLLEVRAGDGALLGAAELAGTAGPDERITTVLATEGGVWVAGSADGAGFIADLRRGWIRPVPAQPLGLAARGRRLAAVWATAEGATLATLDAGGKLAWARTAAGLWGPTTVTAAPDGWTVTGSWEGGLAAARLGLDGAPAGGVTSAGPRASDATPWAARAVNGQLEVLGSAMEAPLAASRWYGWSPMWRPSDLTLPLTLGGVGAGSLGGWRDATAGTWPWDAAADLETRDLAGASSAGRALAVTFGPAP